MKSPRVILHDLAWANASSLSCDWKCDWKLEGVDKEWR